MIVRAFDGDMPINGLKLSAEVLPVPEGRSRLVPLHASAPGTYSGDLGGLGTWPGVLLVRRGADRGVVYRRAVGGRYPWELARVGVNRAALDRLARWTGGRVASPEELLDHLRSLARAGWRDVWAWLLGGALALMVVDWLAGGLRLGPAGAARAPDKKTPRRGDEAARGRG